MLIVDHLQPPAVYLERCLPTTVHLRHFSHGTQRLYYLRLNDHQCLCGVQWSCDTVVLSTHLGTSGYCAMIEHMLKVMVNCTVQYSTVRVAYTSTTFLIMISRMSSDIMT